MNIAVNPSHIAELTPQGAPGPARPAEPAHVIRDDAEAIRVAHALAARFRDGASERDRTGARPLAELDAFSQSGLWSINVPRSHGGPEVSYRTLAQVVAIVAAADPSIAQIAQNHLGIVAAIRTVSIRSSRRTSSPRCSPAPASATPSRRRARSAPPSSRPASPITATTSSSGAKVLRDGGAAGPSRADRRGR